MATYLEQVERFPPRREPREFVSPTGRVFVSYNYYKPNDENRRPLVKLGNTGIEIPPFGHIAYTLLVALDIATDAIMSGGSLDSLESSPVLVLDTSALFFPFFTKRQKEDVPIEKAIDAMYSEVEKGDMSVAQYAINSFFSYAEALKFICSEGRVFLPPVVKEEEEKLMGRINCAFRGNSASASSCRQFLHTLHSVLEICEKRTSPANSAYGVDRSVNADRNIIEWSKRRSGELNKRGYIMTQDGGLRSVVEKHHKNYIGSLGLNSYGLPSAIPFLWIPKEGRLQEQFVSLLGRRWGVRTLDELLRA